ncbi:hypothetical protein EBU71_10105 [bacterium]|nr:hypothetical protein [Candidatus Elulimicrobium humile]
MPYSVVDKPSKYFNTLTWTGTGSSSGRSFTGVGFKPDLVWQKVRGTTYGHWIADAIRGSGKRLATNTTNAEESNSIYGYLTTFDTDGFTTVAGSTDNTGWNETSQTYVSWNWLGANTTASNTSGTITSTVSANTTSGFSIVSYTGTGANATVGHGLGAVPKMYMVKCRSTTGDWRVYTTPTSSVFSLGTNANGNSSGATYIAYCFAEVKGFSKFGSYTGNGSADGTFVYTGFKPAFVIFKLTSGADSWVIKDNKRDSINQMSKRIFPDLSNAEDSGSGGEMDFLSNGFKFRSGSTSLNNGSGSSYIYMAFAENPFVSSKGIPACAR